MRALAVAVVGLLAGCGRIDFDDAPARSTLSLDRLAPGSALASFPVPITLDASRANLSKLTAETFHAFIGSTELAVDVESAGPPFVAWVLVPSITDLTTSFTIEYGGAPVTHAPVWDASYAGVWHMGADVQDSSPAARATQSTALTGTTGVIGPASAYTPDLQSCVTVPSLATYSLGNTTLSGWMFLETSAIPTFYQIITRQLADQPVDDFILGVDPSFQSLGAIATQGGSPSRSGDVVSVGVWHHYAFTFDGATSTLYVDGAVVRSGAANGTPVTSPNPGFIGCGRNNMVGPNDQPDNGFIAGALDEVHLEATARSQPWLAYEYAAGLDQIITYGPVR